MINLHVANPAGVNLQSPDHQSDAHLTEPPRPAKYGETFYICHTVKLMLQFVVGNYYNCLENLLPVLTTDVLLRSKKLFYQAYLSHLELPVLQDGSLLCHRSLIIILSIAITFLCWVLLMATHKHMFYGEIRQMIYG